MRITKQDKLWELGSRFQPYAWLMLTVRKAGSSDLIVEEYGEMRELYRIIRHYVETTDLIVEVSMIPSLVCELPWLMDVSEHTRDTANIDLNCTNCVRIADELTTP